LRRRGALEILLSTAIRTALEFAAAKDPLALAAAVHAMELALGLLLAQEEARSSAG
jgi:hypothetical protein